MVSVVTYLHRWGYLLAGLLMLLAGLIIGAMSDWHSWDSVLIPASGALFGVGWVRDRRTRDEQAADG